MTPTPNRLVRKATAPEPIGFGLLTCDNKAQAEARAGGEHGNKGWDAALAAMQMADLFDRLDASDED